MLDEWSTQRARRVRVCALRAMHVPNLDIPHIVALALWIHPAFPFLHRSMRKVLACACRAVALI